MVPGLGSLSYIQRLIAFDLEPLELRRLHHDLIILHKIRHGHTDLIFDHYFKITPVPHRQDKILVNTSRTYLMLFSFFCRSVRM